MADRRVFLLVSAFLRSTPRGNTIETQTFLQRVEEGLGPEPTFATDRLKI